MDEIVARRPGLRHDFQQWSPADFMEFVEMVFPGPENQLIVNTIRELGLDGDIIGEMVGNPVDEVLLPIPLDKYRLLKRNARAIVARHVNDQMQFMVEYEARRDAEREERERQEEEAAALALEMIRHPREEPDRVERGPQEEREIAMRQQELLMLDQQERGELRLLRQAREEPDRVGRGQQVEFMDRLRPQRQLRNLTEERMNRHREMLQIEQRRREFLERQQAEAAMLAARPAEAVRDDDLQRNQLEARQRQEQQEERRVQEEDLLAQIRRVIEVREDIERDGDLNPEARADVLERLQRDQQRLQDRLAFLRRRRPRVPEEEPVVRAPPAQQDQFGAAMDRMMAQARERVRAEAVRNGDLQRNQQEARERQEQQEQRREQEDQLEDIRIMDRLRMEIDRERNPQIRAEILEIVQRDQQMIIQEIIRRRRPRAPEEEPVVRAPPEQQDQFAAARNRMMAQARERARAARRGQNRDGPGARAVVGNAQGGGIRRERSPAERR